MSNWSFTGKSLRVLTTGAPCGGLMDVLRAFEMLNGTVAFVHKAPVKKALAVLESGAQVDLVALSEDGINAAKDLGLLQDQKFARLGGSKVGLFVGPAWEGHVPDVSSHEGLIEAMQIAATVGITDPRVASGGRLIMGALGRQAWFLNPEFRRKILIRHFQSGDDTFGAAAIGQIRAAMGLICEGMKVHGLRFAGALPPDVNGVTQYVAGISATVSRKNLVHARELLELLAESRPTFIVHGLDEEPAP